jgi:hypothetical protein
MAVSSDHGKLEYPEALMRGLPGLAVVQLVDIKYVAHFFGLDPRFFRFVISPLPNCGQQDFNARA